MFMRDVEVEIRGKYHEWEEVRDEYTEDEFVQCYDRICGECGVQYFSGWEPDPCLGMIPFVSFACCGHSPADDSTPYVAWGHSNSWERVVEELDEPEGLGWKSTETTGLIIRGPQARLILEDMKRGFDAAGL